MTAVKDNSNEPKPKRTRKPRAKPEEVAEPAETSDGETPKGPRKRGRKPKGGKIVTIVAPVENVVVPEPNIILHLRCGVADLESGEFLAAKSARYNPGNITTIDAFQFKTDTLSYEQVPSSKLVTVQAGAAPKEVDDVITEKLKMLAVNLHTNNISDKKAACFWCTCDFDNPPIYIPKHELEGSYHVYGCFCSPECACAHLFRDPQLSSSAKFERYSLLNYMYCKIYDYKKNIKPAPDPFHTLDKYYGNLTIQEYRHLLKNERVLLVVDKPLTRSLPEIHEDNDEYLLSAKSMSAGSKYRLRRSSKKPTKSEILSSNFNLGT